MWFFSSEFREIWLSKRRGKNQQRLMVRKKRWTSFPFASEIGIECTEEMLVCLLTGRTGTFVSIRSKWEMKPYSYARWPYAVLSVLGFIRLVVWVCANAPTGFITRGTMSSSSPISTLAKRNNQMMGRFYQRIIVVLPTIRLITQIASSTV